MSSLQGKPLETITEKDLQQMVTQGEQESQTLEYKREPYKRNDEETREMLRDITSIANAFGGDLLIGVDEDANGAALQPIGIKNPEEESQRIVSSCLSNIAERIDRLLIHHVPLRDGSFVLVVRIPRSLRAPHIVTFKGLNQFWIRHDRQKSPMSIHEIKDTCLKVEGLMEKLERFLAKRRHDIIEDIGTVPYYVVSVTPFFVNSKAIDTQDKALHNLLTDPAPFDESGNFSFRRGLTFFTLHGLRIQYNSYPHYSHPLSAHLFRNGHVEFWLEASTLSPNLDVEKPQVINQFSSEYLISYSFAFISLATRVFAHTRLTDDPVIVSVSFYNIKGRGLQLNRGIRTAPIYDHQRWNKDHLEIEPLQFFSLSPVKATTKECLDRIFQAFGYEAAPDLPNDLLDT